MRPIDADAFDGILCDAEIEATKQKKYVLAGAINTIRGNMAKQPTVNQWIPCSERLPEREGRYLVTNSVWGSWTVDVCAWIGHWHSDDKPIAWMELPEEWKGEKDETTI